MSGRFLRCDGTSTIEAKVPPAFTFKIILIRLVETVANRDIRKVLVFADEFLKLESRQGLFIRQLIGKRISSAEKFAGLIVVTKSKPVQDRVAEQSS